MNPYILESRKDHEERRANAIHEAVNHAIEHKLPIPSEWISEYNELVYRTSEHSVFTHPTHNVPRPELVGKIDDVLSEMMDEGTILHWLTMSTLPACGIESADITSTSIPEAVNCFQCKSIMKDWDRS